jgi:Tfp pilus assembly protein PilO
MKSSDRTILVVVGVLGLVAAFWFLVLTPKRQEASDLADQAASLQSQVVQEEATAATSATAKTDFKSNYRDLITLGKAVPVDADTSSLLTQLQTLSQDADVKFQSISLGGGGGAAAAVAPTTTPTGATPTEASAALLPIGATVGAAGLPIMPYSLQFHGGFFQIADFFGELDDLVDAGGDEVVVNGRLLTINSFTLTPGGVESEDPNALSASVDVTSYLSPADQGATGGATVTGPPTAGIPAVEPTTTDTGVAPAVVTP